MNQQLIKVKRDVDDRQGYLGGSSWGAALGMSVYKTPYDVAQEYIGNKKEVSEETQAIFDMGHELEGFIASQVERIYGLKLRRSNYLYISSRDNRLGCHPDRMVVGLNEAVEIKSSSAYDSGRWGADGTDEVPYDYLVQCYSYMECIGVEKVHLFRFSNNRITHYIVNRPDASVLDSIVEKLKRFMDNCDKGIMPAPESYSEACDIWEPKEGAVEADLDIHNLVQQYNALSAEAKDIDKQMDAIKLELLRKLNEAEASSAYDVATGSYLVTYTTTVRNSLDSKALQKDLPEIAEKYMKTTTYSQMRVGKPARR